MFNLKTKESVVFALKWEIMIDTENAVAQYISRLYSDKVEDSISMHIYAWIMYNRA